jgi:molecular chaperone IbpA
MRRYDLSPLLQTVAGFSDSFNGNGLNVGLSRAFPATRAIVPGNSYPSYNFAKTGEDTFRLTLAVAGFADDDLDVTVDDGVLVITGRQAPEAEDITYLSRGFAAEGFERRFNLAEDIVVGEARLENGLLHIELQHQVPEHRKPRRITIGAGEARQAA